ncbi:hypothetical protein BHE90_004425 [Fusarium euwallaceae]|uniref:Uncharacterized protein n=1 Tax=Fusarium euwallaceae TaxID=1147111 RepID=A0A430LZC4_9HYPO|nr:hypothetical protein BHE90_004425 [Fusarium euwallaceae]
MLNLFPVKIYHIAVLADKYQMVERFAMVMPYFFRARTMEPVAAWRMMVAAYLLKSENGFGYFSSGFIGNKVVSLLKYASLISDRVLALKLCLAIEEFRNRGKTNKGLCLYCFNKGEESGLGFVTKDPGCKFGSHYPV